MANDALNKSIHFGTPTIAIASCVALLTMTGCSSDSDKDKAVTSETVSMNQSFNGGDSKSTFSASGGNNIVFEEENKVPPRPSSPIKPPILWPKHMDEGDSYARQILEPERKNKKPEPVVKEPSGLEYQDIDIGYGLSPSDKHMAMVHYTGYLSDGTRFESSKDRGLPFEFIVGTGKVIPGFEQGIMGMKVGGRRKVVIPPSLAYGAEGHGNKVPPNSTLVYDIRLLSCDR